MLLLFCCCWNEELGRPLAKNNSWKRTIHGMFWAKDYRAVKIFSGFPHFPTNSQVFRPSSHKFGRARCPLRNENRFRFELFEECHSTIAIVHTFESIRKRKKIFRLTFISRKHKTFYNFRLTKLKVITKTVKSNVQNKKYDLFFINYIVKVVYNYKNSQV